MQPHPYRRHRTCGALLCVLLVCCPSWGQAVRKGESLSHARKALLAQGWKPRETFGLDGNGERWALFADAGLMHRAGIVEVQDCTGTGLNYCAFNYLRRGQCLTLQTEGEFKPGAYEPKVIRTLRKCPDAEYLGPPAR